MTALSRYLVEHRGDFNIDDRVAKAQEAGHDINRATVYKALKGQHAKNPPDATLLALASVFGLDVRNLRKLADKPPGELGPWEPTDEAGQLSQDQRDALDALIKTIVHGVVRVDQADNLVAMTDEARADRAAREVAAEHDYAQQRAAKKATSTGREKRKQQDREGEAGGS